MRFPKFSRLGAIAIAMTAAEGGEITVQSVSTRLALLVANPAPGHEGTDPKLEASAIEPIGDGSRLLVADDKTVPGLVVIDAATGRRVGEPLSLGKLAEGPIAPKWEGMARDGDFYYVIGSHSGKSKERAARSRLLRFQFASVDPPRIDIASVVPMDLTASLAEVEGFRVEGDTKKDDPVKIEGLTIRATKGGKELVIGLRKPNDTIRAYAAPLPESAGAPAALKLHRLFAFEDPPVGEVRRELGSLEYSPEWGGFFIVTLCEDEANHFEENVLYFLPDAAIVPGGLSKPTKVWSFARGFKCEGVAVLPRKAGGSPDELDLILSFDNDAATTKMPSMIQEVTLKRGR